MNKIQDKIVQADFKKIARRFIVAAIVFVVAGAAAGGLLLKPQIQDAYTLHQNKDKIVAEVQAAADAKAASQAQNTDQVQAQDQTQTSDQAQKADKASASDQKADKHKKGGDHEKDQHKEDREGGDNEKDHEVDWEEICKDQITPPSTGAFVGLGILGAIGLAFGIVYWLLIAAWLYQAATKAKMNRIVWCIAGLICNLAAVVVFLIVRSIVRITCGNCGTVQKRQEFCSHCGAVLERKCDVCMSKLGPDDEFCGRCGKQCGETVKTEEAEETADDNTEEKDS